MINKCIFNMSICLYKMSFCLYEFQELLTSKCSILTSKCSKHLKSWLQYAIILRSILSRYISRNIYRSSQLFRMLAAVSFKRKTKKPKKQNCKRLSVKERTRTRTSSLTAKLRKETK